jgi:hypothetical protein
MQVITHSIKIIQYIRQFYLDRPVKLFIKQSLANIICPHTVVSIETGRLYNIERNVDF